jgi:hypothetical protein
VSIIQSRKEEGVNMNQINLHPGEGEGVNRSILFYSRLIDLESFRRFAYMAAELGATHVNVDSLPFNRWRWELDLNDPYPNWSMITFTLFDVAVPEVLKQWIPADRAERNLELIARKGQVLRELGLKGLVMGCEPMWLPGGAYREHPEWRGPRCNHPLRSRNSYYSPCIDNAEVLAMYKESVAKLCRAAPIDRFSFLTNDSGAGLCWSEGLYPGVNGPSACRQRPLPERISSWMSAMQEGAAQAGQQAQINLYGTIPASEVNYTAGQLLRDQLIEGRGPGISAAWAEAGAPNFMYASFQYPVKELPQAVDFAEQLERAFGRQHDNVVVGFPSDRSRELFEVFRQFRKQGGSGLAARAALLRNAAEGIAGSESAGQLLDVWEQIRRAIDAITPLENGGPILLLGVVGQRWLTRPLVPFPLELADERKAYYRRFQFQARSEQNAADLMDCQAAKFAQGKVGTWLASKLLNRAINHAQAAIQLLGAMKPGTAAAQAQAAGAEAEGWNREELQRRLRVFVCMLRCALHTANYQDLLERSRSASAEPEVDRGGTARILPVDMQTVVRAETDNMLELIGLLESAAEAPLITASEPDDESVFLLSPDLVRQLRLKIDLMEEHFMEHKRLNASS